MRSYKGRGIVLHTIKYGESSMIAYLLTDVGGRRSFVVQGVRSSHGRGSKLSIFQPLFPVEFEGLESPKMEMHRFREVRCARAMQSIPFDVRKSTIALFMAETLYRLVRESEANEALFEFVWSSIEALDEIEEGVANFHLWFLANLSRLLGFSPANNYSSGAWFDIAEGEYTMLPPMSCRALSPANAVILNDLLECDVRYLGEIGLNRHQRVDFLNSMLIYYGYHLDAIHAVQSVKILQEVF